MYVHSCMYVCIGFTLRYRTLILMLVIMLYVCMYVCMYECMHSPAVHVLYTGVTCVVLLFL